MKSTTLIWQLGVIFIIIATIGQLRRPSSVVQENELFSEQQELAELKKQLKNCFGEAKRAEKSDMKLFQCTYLKIEK